MSAIGSAIGDAVAAFLGDPTVGVVARLIASYIVLVWLAVALWAFVDMRRRTTHLASAYGAAGLVILASPLLFPLTVVILRIVRPATFVAEHRLALARESVLEADFMAPRCPDCRRVIDPGTSAETWGDQGFGLSGPFWLCGGCEYGSVWPTLGTTCTWSG